MNTQTLDQRVEPQKAALAARTAAHEEAVALVAYLLTIKADNPAYSSAQMQIPSAVLAESVTRDDRQAAQRDLTAAIEAARRALVAEHRPDLAARVQRVNKSFAAFVAAVADLDACRAALTEVLGGAAEQVPACSPMPNARERAEMWRQAMSGEGLL